ncbi:threonine/homoserine/homoserine lactone efflux protein [Nocardia transvalensis]|uniref:Threonine/homoserine/homoserine lactone efflux protein n=1 Tax=Nocardia transvalensis TaxID=37333 RepID=A0A7W9P8M7_9NOCA|nr:GAP family protein [Nocardia transvalensis]MBB5911213.1 threonine/homoserine/homoserine lactone efflux protein [Nocardia transvalensis]
MGDLFARLAPEIVGLLITPGAIAGCILLLHSREPIRNPLAFGGAFLLAYTLIAASALLGGASEPGSTSTGTSSAAGLAVGLLFLAAGAWIATRPRQAVPSAPKWLTQLRTADPRKAFVVGLVFAILNPNLFIMMSGMSVISSSHVGAGPALLAVVLLLLAAVLDFLVPIAVYLALGARARTALDGAEAWMIRNNRSTTMAVLFGFGILFTLRGIVNLS